MRIEDALSAVPSARSSALLAILVFAGGMALFSEHHAFPFYYHGDEPGKVLQVIYHRMNFHHPTLMLTAANLARRTFLHGGAERDPQRVVEVGRLVVAAFAAGSAALLAFLAARLLGLWAGLAAGLLLVTNPLLYELAHYFKEDPPLVFGVAACALAAHHLGARRDARSLVWMGVAAGVAAAGKYVGAVLLPVAMALGARAGGGPARERWKRAGKVAGSALLTWVVLDYRIFRAPGRLPQSVRVEMRKAFVRTHGLLKWVPSPFYLSVQGRYGGWWVPALASLWLAFAIFRPRKVSVAEWLLAGVSLLYLVAFSLTPRTTTRYYLPIAVTLCFLAAAGVFHWAALAGARWERARIGASVLAFLLCLGAAGRQWRDTQALRRAFGQDDRVELIQAIEALPATAIVAQDEEVALPEPDRLWQHRGRAPLQHQVIGAEHASDLGSLAALRARGVTHLALCRKVYRHYLAGEPLEEDPHSLAARRAFYQTALKRGRVLREWRPGRVTYLQPGLVLVDISGIE